MSNYAIKLVSKPQADFSSLCGAVHQATDRNIAGYADAKRNMSEDRKLMTCLESFIERDPMTFNPLVLSHLHFSVLVACETWLVPIAMVNCSELACLSTESKVRGLSCLIISGNLNGFRSAVLSGIRDKDARELFSALLSTFRAEGYGEVFTADFPKAIR